VTAAILGLLAALVPLLVWLIRRRLTAQDDPTQQHRDRISDLDSDIATRDVDAANTHAARDLDELERLQNTRPRDSHGSGRDPRAGR
jgi:hypothetical protein